MNKLPQLRKRRALCEHALENHIESRKHKQPRLENYTQWHDDPGLENYIKWHDDRAQVLNVIPIDIIFRAPSRTGNPKP